MSVLLSLCINLNQQKELIKALEENIMLIFKMKKVIFIMNITIIDIKKCKSSGFSQGSWIHPDLACEDGFVNATAMCKAGEKLFADWKRLDYTKK